MHVRACICACACVHVRVRGYVRRCVHVHVRACICACARVHVRLHLDICMLWKAKHQFTHRRAMSMCVWGGVDVYGCARDPVISSCRSHVGCCRQCRRTRALASYFALAADGLAVSSGRAEPTTHCDGLHHKSRGRKVRVRGALVLRMPAHHTHGICVCA